MDELRNKVSDLITEVLFERFESPSSAVIGVALADRILAIPEIAEAESVKEIGGALLSHLDAIMPAIERGIAANWKRGNYVNGPQFGEALAAFRTLVQEPN